MGDIEVGEMKGNNFSGEPVDSVEDFIEIFGEDLTNKEKQELDRKLQELSHSKRHTLKRTFSHMRKRHSDKKHQQQKTKQLKKKYGKFYNTYKQLEPRLTANLANKVIMIAKDYDKQQNKYQKDLKQLNKKKQK